MQMVPKTTSSARTSGSERKVFKLLEATPDSATVVHSLNLAEHDYQRVGEIDFLIVSPRGLFALEVKGGRVSRSGGIWTITNRRGQARQEERGPFKQAEGGIFSLVRRLRETGHADLLHDVCFGYGVVFPDVTFDQPSVEWAPEMVCDEERLRQDGGIARFVNGLMSYWEEKGRYRRRRPDEIEGLLHELRPEFVRVPSLRHRSEEIEEEFVSLTNEQYARLELIEGADRILCSGGAGTGKTFLAVEAARRERDAGQEVTLSCVSPHLLRFLAAQPDVDEIRIASLDDLRRVTNDSIGCLVLDEAQDVMNLDDLAIFDRVLHGGLEHGRWRIFLDMNNQADLVGSFAPEAIELLQSFGAVAPALKRNCRNTQRIVTETRLLTGADIGTPSAGAGPAPIIEYHDDLRQAARCLTDRLDQLVAEDIAPDEMVILSCAGDGPSCVEHLDSRWRRRTGAGAQASRRGVVGVWPVADFKGLEAAHVCLIDVHSVDDDAIPALYVGMTRARVSLWISLDSRIQPDVRARVSINAAAGALEVSK